ncbi:MULTISPECIES: hypothetical protein [unclassified Duganella]|nr:MULTISPECIES: hypothetical protein [unclassified Duganella]
MSSLNWLKVSASIIADAGIQLRTVVWGVEEGVTVGENYSAVFAEMLTGH